ncbi:PepSY-associated TM helix domain-containing protein [Zunongwangia sp. H14]|uniref:PepSY-associated TM helix domain-containing protein n=1 Tax=Zunongwangia sp. H14 TaxID=3240792 RepID=UPI003564C722
MKKKRNHTLKKWIGKLHLWLGLLSGIIVFLLAVTGCIFVFSAEINEQIRKDELYVIPEENPLPVSELWQRAQDHIGPEMPISWAYIYNSPEKSWVFYAYKTNPDAITYFGNLEYYKAIYINPYTGEILDVYDEEYDFFNIIKFLHWSLLLKTEIGQPIVGWATFIFVIMLISGIILWWPVSRNAAKQRFSFKWKDSTSWKRKNYDLHNILGFYVSSLALILAITGMVWAFTWMKGLVYTAGALSTTPPEIEYKQSNPSAAKIAHPIDVAYHNAVQAYPESNGFRFTPASGETGAINVYVQEYEGVYYKSHALQFDQYSGALINIRDYKEKNFGERLIDANYDIHVGAILGIPGKVMMFFASLICGSLPLTGFLVWWKRKSKFKYLFRS